VTLSATLYLPPGYKKGERLPVIMWAYPREFGDVDSASQVSGSANRFTIVSGYSHRFLLLSGYAIFDNPTMPIIGAGETANDRYVEQLVDSAQAATYEDLLRNEHDDALFEHYFTSQIGIAGGEKIGKPAIYGEVTPSFR
jgi:dipeptidyl aminopeptidase/acylaminoacyl peptidase